MRSVALFILLFTLRCFFDHVTRAQLGNDSHCNEKYPAVYIDLNTRNEIGLACPATTEREKKFNSEVSVTGKSVFLKIVDRCDKVGKNITAYICDSPLQPATVYNLERGTYEIGYEFYYEQGKAQLKDDKYPFYKSVKIDEHSKPLDEFVSSRCNDKYAKFVFKDGSPTLVFYWISHLSIHPSSCKKRVEWNKNPGFLNYDWESKFQDYQSDKWNEINVKILYPKAPEPKMSDACYNESKNIDEQSHEVLVKSQIMPLWYFETYSGRLASCTEMNTILVWRDIADKQLKKVDLFIAVVLNYLEAYNRKDQKVIFGINGEHKRQLYYTSDAEHLNKFPIPKIIYRLILGTSFYECFGVAIIIHNELYYVPDSDRLCRNDTKMSSWDKIRNDDPKTGLTYVCPLTKKLIKILGIGLRKYGLREPIRLDAIPYCINPQWDCTYLIKDHDLKSEINNDFEQLFRGSIGWKPLQPIPNFLGYNSESELVNYYEW